MLNKRVSITGFIALVVLAAALPASAQAPYLAVHYDAIDPASSAEYEANSRDWVAAYTEAGLGAEHGWRGYQSNFTYAWVSDVASYAFLDGAAERFAAASAAVGEEKMAALIAGGNGISEHYTEIWKFEPDLTYAPNGAAPEGMTFINVGVHHVKPGMDDEYKAVVKDAIAALAKIGAEASFVGYSIPFGRGSYAYVSWGEDRAALHSGPEMGALLAEALGPEGAQAIFGRYVESISSVEDTDWAIRADLNFTGATKPMEDAGE